MVTDAESALRALARAEECGSDLIELRVDQVACDHQLVEMLLDRSTRPCILTCRLEEEGGHFTGPETERIALYEAACAVTHPPRFLDVELAAYERSPDLRQALARLSACSDSSAFTDKNTPSDRPSLILSLHDFKGRPGNLNKRLLAMLDSPECSVMKIATRARSLRDSLEIFDLLDARGKPMIAIGMGEFGSITRILAGKFGSLVTFASLSSSSATAPGQLTVEDLLQTYNFRNINQRTEVYGVLGYPVEHSLGPQLHNRCFRDINIDSVYVRLPVAPGWEPFKATLPALLEHEKLNLAGLSVTIPHKEHLVKLARQEGFVIDQQAQLIGAGNTLSRIGNNWRVSNTDITAVQSCLDEKLHGEDYRGLTAAVIGAGGAAAAVAAALALRGAEVHIFNRTRERAEKLAQQLATLPGEVTAADIPAPVDAAADILVNATSVGMSTGPAPEKMPAADECLDENVLVFETVYTPVETPLVRAAREKGCRLITGEQMFLAQAAQQQLLWTGTKPSPAYLQQVWRQINA